MKRIKLRCLLHRWIGMYKIAFLQANQFNPGVASTIKTDGRGKTARYSNGSWTEWGRWGTSAQVLTVQFQRVAHNAIGPMLPPGWTQDRKSCVPTVTQPLARECPHSLQWKPQARLALLPTSSGIWRPSQCSSQMPWLAALLPSHAF